MLRGGDDLNPFGTETFGGSATESPPSSEFGTSTISGRSRGARGKDRVTSADMTKAAAAAAAAAMMASTSGAGTSPPKAAPSQPSPPQRSAFADDSNHFGGATFGRGGDDYMDPPPPSTPAPQPVAAPSTRPKLGAKSISQQQVAPPPTPAPPSRTTDFLPDFSEADDFGAPPADSGNSFNPFETYGSPAAMDDAAPSSSAPPQSNTFNPFATFGTPEGMDGGAPVNPFDEWS